jgi:hypothetical protein
MESVNPMLLLVVIAGVCFGICAWQCPQLLRRTAAHLLTRADVIDASRKEHEQRIGFWRGELGVDRKPPGEDASDELLSAHPIRPEPLNRGKVVPQAR